MCLVSKTLANYPHDISSKWLWKEILKLTKTKGPREREIITMTQEDWKVLKAYGILFFAQKYTYDILSAGHMQLTRAVQGRWSKLAIFINIWYTTYKQQQIDISTGLTNCFFIRFFFSFSFFSSETPFSYITIEHIIKTFK